MTTTTKPELFVDTSGWSCYFDKRESYHQETVAVIQASFQQRRKLVTTNYVISELFALLSSRNKISQADVITIVETIRNLPYVEIVTIDADLDTAALALLKNRLDKAWSWVDASSFVVMQGHGIVEALTLDHHFEQAGFVRLPEQG